jgi:hypothetical protein
VNVLPRRETERKVTGVRNSGARIPGAALARRWVSVGMVSVRGAGRGLDSAALPSRLAIAASVVLLPLTTCASFHPGLAVCGDEGGR